MSAPDSRFGFGDRVLVEGHVDGALDADGDYQVSYTMADGDSEFAYVRAGDVHPVPPDDGDEHHTLDELYTYRMLYNAHAANLWAEHGTYPVVKSWRHHDGEECFGGGWFIVTATLPAGQVSNHYPAADWDRFRVPQVPAAPEWDGHTPAVAAERLRAALDAPPAPADPLAHIRTGDEDPTADLAGDDCPAVWARGWGCTRDLGHPGQHIAGDGAIVCATLPAGGAW